MYFIKATVKHIKDGAVTSETFSELLNLATLELSAGVFARDVVEKFGEDATFVIEDGLC